MKVLFLQGSPRKNGHTKQFSQACMDELRLHGAHVEEIWLHDQQIGPCLECGVCQEKIGEFGCVRQDDMQGIYEQITGADLLVFSVPIFAGFAPGPVKTFMDRLIYPCAKNYGAVKAPSLIGGKRCAILLTSGRKPEDMLPGFEFAVKVLCRHLNMEYVGWTGATDPGKAYTFMTEGKRARAQAFAHQLLDLPESAG